MRGKDLTKRQQQILDFILGEVNRKGYPPSVREIGKALGLSSSSTVHSHLSTLEKKGYLRRDPTKPRALEILNYRSSNRGLPFSKIKSVPLVGEIAAGSPLLASENIEDILPLPSDLIPYEEVFILKVKGDSMIEAGIYHGDYAIVKKQSTANNDEIVVALIEDEATVKRFYKERDCIRLQPENKSMEPIKTKEVLILGKVVAVLRKL